MNEETNEPLPLESQSVFGFAKRLQHAYAERLGILPRHAPVKALIDGDIPATKFAADLLSVGYEMYSDSLGNVVIRTREQGDAHRALVQAEKDLEYVERNPDMRPYARLPSLERFKPAASTSARDRDEEQFEQDE